MILKHVLENILCIDESKVELFGRQWSCYIWRKPNTEFQKNNIILTVKPGGGSVMVWGCFAASGSGQLAVIEGKHEFCSLPENPKGDDAAADIIIKMLMHQNIN